MKSLLIFVSVFLISQACFGQITVTKNDLKKMYESKFVADFSAVDAAGTKMNIGSVGTGNRYDFTRFIYDSQENEITMVEPMMTPYGNEFPLATHAMYISIQGENLYFYLQLDDDGLLNLGYGTEYMGQPIVAKNDPPQIEVKFPGAMGMFWSYDGKPVILFEGATEHTRFEASIDAAGTLILPSGSYECLRLKKVEYLTTKLELLGQVIAEDVIKSVSYRFLTNEGLTAQIDVDTLDENIETATLESASYTLFSDTPTFVEQTPTQHHGCWISQCFPNPVSASSGYQTTISWGMESPEYACVKVFTLNGQLITTLWDGHTSASRNTSLFNASGLESGTYFIQLQTKDATVHRLISVLK